MNVYTPLHLVETARRSGYRCLGGIVWYSRPTCTLETPLTFRYSVSAFPLYICDMYVLKSSRFPLRAPSREAIEREKRSKEGLEDFCGARPLAPQYLSGLERPRVARLVCVPAPPDGAAARGRRPGSAAPSGRPTVRVRAALRSPSAPAAQRVPPTCCPRRLMAGCRVERRALQRDDAYPPALPQQR